jgi:division protein CdvB (Snf7/Vps24/ESCRT-III family)
MPLAENWERKAGEGIIRRITGNFRRERPLKERLEHATREIKILNSQLSNALLRIKQRDKAIFSRVISAIQENDKEHASIYANELSELRRLGKFVSQAQLALELILLRLETVLELGELTAKSLAPSISVLKSIQGQVVDVLPEAKKNVEDLFTILNGVLTELSMETGVNVNLEVADGEAKKILEEAEVVAENRMKETFPEVPSELQLRNSEEILE